MSAKHKSPESFKNQESSNNDLNPWTNFLDEVNTSDTDPESSPDTDTDLGEDQDFEAMTELEAMKDADQRQAQEIDSYYAEHPDQLTEDLKLFDEESSDEEPSLEPSSEPMTIPVTEIVEQTDFVDAEPIPRSLQKAMDKYDGHPTASELAPLWDDFLTDLKPNAFNAQTPRESDFYVAENASLINDIAHEYRPTDTQLVNHFINQAKRQAKNERSKPIDEQNSALLDHLKTEQLTFEATKLALEHHPKFNTTDALNYVIGQMSTSQHISDRKIAHVATELSQTYDDRIKGASYAIGRQVASDALREYNASKSPESDSRAPQTHSTKPGKTPKPSLDPNVIS